MLPRNVYLLSFLHHYLTSVDITLAIIFLFIYFFPDGFSVLGNDRNEYRFITKANCFFPLKIDTGGPTDILNKKG